MDNGEYKMCKSDDAYNYGLARIKPFLTSNARLKVFKIIEKNNLEENVIRIHTDGIVLNKPFDFDKIGIKYYQIIEDKTTGYMIWNNKLNGFHICKKCQKEFIYKKFIEHSC